VFRQRDRGTRKGAEGTKESRRWRLGTFHRRMWVHCVWEELRSLEYVKDVDRDAF
jgi:hypothetical protein